MERGRDEDECAACDAMNCAQEQALFSGRKLIVVAKAVGEVTGLAVVVECGAYDRIIGDRFEDRQCCGKIVGNDLVVLRRHQFM